MEFIPEGATLNKHFFKEILRCLRIAFRRKRPEVWRRMNTTTPSVCPRRGGKISGHLVAMPSILAWSRYAISFSFLAWKKSYVGVDFSRARRSSLPQGIQCKTFLQICIFQQCFRRLYQRRQTCIAANGDYSEGGCECVCVCVCEYLVIWRDKTTVREIIDCVTYIYIYIYIYIWDITWKLKVQIVEIRVVKC
jgi:hypothetical protein